MFAGITASALIGAMGAALQVLAVATLLLSKLDEMLLALRRVLSNATSEAKGTHAAAKMAALDIRTEKLWNTVDAAERAADDAVARAEELRAAANKAEDAIYKQRIAIIETLSGATKESA
jgi:hypothetical protein